VCLIPLGVGALARRGAVVAQAVGFNDEAKLGPEEVDAVAVDVLLGEGARRPARLAIGRKRRSS
jgi:hypothetical protein